MRAGGALLFGKLAMACPQQIADIFLQRGMYTSGDEGCSLDGRIWCCRVEEVLVAVEISWFALDSSIYI